MKCSMYNKKYLIIPVICIVVISALVLLFFKINISIMKGPNEARAEVQLPVGINRFEYSDEVCYTWKSEYAAFANTSYVGGISCFKK